MDFCECLASLVNPVATPWGGQGGQSATLDSEKIAKNWEKEGQNQENTGKEGKNQEKEEKLGRFFHFAPPDR